MPDFFKFMDEAKLYPPFRAKAEQLVAALHAAKQDFYATADGGLRTWAQQNALYARGRDARGNVVDRSKVVTWARAGFSPHNYGVACDFCHDADLSRAGLQMDWTPRAYKPLAAAAGKLALEAGYNWVKVDPPHVQLPLEAKGLTFATLKRAYEKNGGGLKAVWKLLDGYAW